MIPYAWLTHMLLFAAGLARGGTIIRPRTLFPLGICVDCESVRSEVPEAMTD